MTVFINFNLLNHCSMLLYSSRLIFISNTYHYSFILVARYPDLSNLKQDFEALVDFIETNCVFVLKVNELNHVKGFARERVVGNYSNA